LAAQNGIICPGDKGKIGEEGRSYSSSPWRWRQQGPPNHWYPTTSKHTVTIQKTMTNILEENHHRDAMTTQQWRGPNYELMTHTHQIYCA